MATFQIGSFVYTPKCIRDDMRLCARVLAGPLGKVIKSFAEAANLKPTVVARATANGAVTFTGAEFQVFSSTGVRLTLKQARSSVCSFQRAATKANAKPLAQWRTVMRKKAATFEQRKAQRVAKIGRAAAKCALAEMDGPTNGVSGRAMSRLLSAHRADVRARQNLAKQLCALKAHIKKRKQMRSLFLEAPVENTHCPARQGACADFLRFGEFDVPLVEEGRGRSRVRNLAPRLRSSSVPTCRAQPYIRQVLTLNLPDSTKSFFRAYASRRCASEIARDVVYLTQCYGTTLHVLHAHRLDANSTQQHIEDVAAQLRAESAEVRELMKDQRAEAGFGWMRRVSDAFTRKTTELAGIFSDSAKEVVDYTAQKTTSVINGCVSVAGDAARSACTGLFDGIRAEFYKMLGPFLGPLASARDEIEKCWRYAKDWALTMWDKAGLELYQLRACGIIGVILLLVTGVVYMVEKLLVHLEILPQVGVILRPLMKFCCHYMIALTVISIYKDEAIQKLFTLLISMIETAIIKEEMAGRGRHAEFRRRRERARSMRDDQILEYDCDAVGIMEVPLVFLQALGNGLCTAPLGTLQYLGRYGQALDQIRKGKDAMREFAGSVIDIVSEAWDNISGRKDTFFQDLKSMTQVNLERWIFDSQQLLLRAQTTAVTDTTLLDSVTHLLEKGHTLQRILAGARRTTSLDYGRVVGVYCAKLLEVRATLARVGKAEGRRCEPFWVYIYGPSHCGKSLFMEEVTRRLLSDNGHALDDIYAKNARDSFWSGYMQHACVQYDDLSACTTEPSVESEFLQTVGSKAYSLNMAAVEDKGMRFNSTLIVSTSNCFSAPTVAQIHDNVAYNNRRGAVLECRRAPNVEFDPDDPSMSCEARLVDPVDQSPMSEWHKSLDILDIVSAMGRVHREKELKLQENFNRRNNSGPQYFKIGKDWLREMAHMLPDTLACDGKVYTLDKMKREARLTSEVPTEGYEELCIDHMQRINGIVVENDTSMLHGFLNGMVQDPCEVVSVDKLTGATATQQKFFAGLSLFERIYLRLVQKKLNATRDDPALCFKSNFRMQILEWCTDSYNMVVKHGGKIFCVILAIFFAVVLFQGFFSLYRMFVGGGTSATASLGLLAQMTANAGMNSSSFSGSGSVSSYGSRNIPIHYRHRSSRSEYSANADDEDENFLPRLTCWITLPDGRLISGARFHGRSMLLTAHQAEMIKDGSRIHFSYYQKGRIARTIPMIWYALQVEHFHNTEAVVYRNECMPTLSKGDAAAYNVDVAELPKLMTLHGSVVKQYQHMITKDPVLASCDATQPIDNRWVSEGAMQYERVAISTRAYGGSYRKELPTSITSNCVTSPWDCGAIMTTLFRGKRVVVGLHVASGEGKNGYVSTSCLVPDVQEQICNAPVPYVEEEGVSTEGYRKIGWIPDMRARPYVAGQTMFQAVTGDLAYEPPALEEDLGDGCKREVTVEIKQPAILRSDDPRIPQGMKYDPLKNGMEKFSSPMSLIDEDLCQEIFTDIAESWHDCFRDLQDVSDEVALNGNEEQFYDALNLSTSEGYPWVLHRGIGESGKHRYIQTDEDTGLRSLIPGTPVEAAYIELQRLAYTQVPDLVCCETPKDECLPLRKIVEKPKTRLFSILPLEYNLLLRKKYLSFCAAIQGNRHRLPTQVGINPYSREWTKLSERLRAQNSVGITCDFASFDGLIVGQILNGIADSINSCYGDTEDSKRQRKNLLLAVVNRKSICGSQVYEVSCGIPSGMALTVILNSIYNEFLMRYVWKTTVVGVPREQFSTYVCLLVYGDDNNITVDPVFLPQFNGRVIQSKLKEVRITITDGSDKTAQYIDEKPIAQLDFLKRRYKKNADGTVSAPLHLSSIYTSLQNVTLGAGSMSLAIRQNVQSALIELFLHGNQSWYNHLRDFYVERADWRDLPRWEEARAFHRGHLTGTVPWVPHRFFEVPIDMQRLQDAMANQGEGAYNVALAPDVFVSGVKWKSTEPETQFVVSTTRLKGGETGLFCPIRFGSEGAGRLPTNQWVYEFSRHNSSTWITIETARKSGKSIHFRGEPPYVANWAAAIRYAQSINYKYEDMLGLYYNVCTPDAFSLDTYFYRPYKEAVPLVVEESRVAARGSGGDRYLCPAKR
uniref:RNA1 polyprotein n=1 Tax=Downy ground fern nepovirus TaxID=3115766 RepID=A0AAT9J7U5_9SECO